MKSPSKAILAIAVALCFLVAGDKIYSFYKAHQPLAAVGECLEINDPKFGTLKMKVMANDNAHAVSDGIIDVEVLPGLKLGVPVRVSYEELRGVNAHKVSCE